MAAPKKRTTTKKTTARKTTRKPKQEAASEPKRPRTRQERAPEVEYERVECWRCGGFPLLRPTCRICKGAGSLVQEIRPGHETLSALRAKMGTRRDPESMRYGDDGQVGPRYSDELWIGSGSPYQ